MIKAIFYKEWIKIRRFYPVCAVVVLGFTLFSVFRGSVLWLLAAVALIYILAARLPFCRKRECLWVFVLAVPALVPVNLRIFFEFHYVLIADYPFWLCVMAAIQDITAMLGIETIVLCILAKVIWKDQYAFGK